MTFEREDETQQPPAEAATQDEDALPAEPADDDSPMGDTDEHSGDAA